MKELLYILLIITGINSYSQELKNDWKELADSTSLRDYVENQAFENLNFYPNGKDSIAYNRVRSDIHSRKRTAIIRDIPKPNIPLLVINQNPLINWILLDYITLKDIEKIEIYKPNEDLSAIYGSLAERGLIIIEINKRKWRKLKRKNIK